MGASLLTTVDFICVSRWISWESYHLFSHLSQSRPPRTSLPPFSFAFLFYFILSLVFVYFPLAHSTFQLFPFFPTLDNSERYPIYCWVSDVYVCLYVCFISLLLSRRGVKLSPHVQVHQPRGTDCTFIDSGTSDQLWWISSYCRQPLVTPPEPTAMPCCSHLGCPLGCRPPLCFGCPYFIAGNCESSC